MAPRKRHTNYQTVPRELPKELCEIFTERVVIVRQPLPNQITAAQCHPRNLYTWRQMDYSWPDMWAHYHPQSNYADAGQFKRDMIMRISRWKRRNLIMERTAQGKAGGSLDETIAEVVQGGYSITQIFFGVKGTLNLANFTYTPARDDYNLPFHPPVANPPNYNLNPPKAPPQWFLEKVEFPKLDDWLARNPTIFGRFFPNAHQAWVASGGSSQPLPPLRSLRLRNASLGVANTSLAPQGQNDADNEDEEEDDGQGAAGPSTQSGTANTNQSGVGSTSNLDVSGYRFRSTASSLTHIPIRTAVKKQRQRGNHEPDSESDGERDSDPDVIERAGRIKAANDEARRRRQG